ncbi:peptidoglycan DD-metalloendopeptidase family protein [Tamlana agarivorans]|uniref:Peptidoglycan DD-metalloendopeptidase family protein n=1 Tax=Pseudotamlana agarivorans TaxID=481183 RepID=A0ACC5U791_9FLAO|nr:peptidoglycan DD-metalloendopeptidase family protein [Tamlana agarivorans]MBU2950123.1 peptidoglycan DD-metalloendopeptidase family protein [Tamlana agarivorans]
MDFSEVLYKVSQHSLGVLGGQSLPKKYVHLDLSETNTDFLKYDLSTSLKFGQFVDQYLMRHGADVAYGGYLEVRNIYKRSSYFNTVDQSNRNIHLGIDLWSPVETPIFAPIAGTLHSFKNNTNFGDYGPTIILEHLYDGFTFYTLYGHLSLASLEGKVVGQKFEAGTKLGTLGDASVNGDYPPHLHFQTIKDIQNYTGDYPGVCAKEELEYYKKNCPDPMPLLKLKK